MKPSLAAAALLILTFPLAMGCRKSPEAAPEPDPDAVVARYAGGEIRRSEIRDAVERRLATVPAPVAPETRRLIVRKVLERRVRIAGMRAAMKAHGHQDAPEAVYSAQAAEDRVLAADRVAGEVQGIKAPDALVAAAVESRLQTVRPEEARKFSHIFLRSPQEDTAARARASATMAEILAEIESGTGFNALAESYSDSVMARGGGRIEWTLRKNLQPAAAEAVFALREGATSPVVATSDGLHLFRVDGIRSGSAIDADAIRRAVRRELDAEAVSLAESALRQREIDAAGVEFVSTTRLERLPENGAGWVARWKGGEILRSELLALTPPASVGEGTPSGAGRAAAVLRALVENRLLAARRRESPLSPELDSQVTVARDAAMLDSYRASLVAGIDTDPTAEEVTQFYRENAEGALFLRDYHADLLFFPQKGDGVAEVYAAGEGVVASLRSGTTFDVLLDRATSSAARICRDAHPIDLEESSGTFLRLRRALLNLEVGEVSPVLYFDGPQSAVSGQCVLEGRGVVFARLREIGTIPLESARDKVRELVAEKKRRAGIDVIQSKLVADSKLEILLPEG